MILVTGGTGMTGACLLAMLAEQGHKVRALKRPGASMAVFELYTRHQPALREQISWVEGDLLDIPSLEDALEGIDTVYHAAAMISFIPAEAGQMQYINISGTANLVNLCLEKPDFRYFAHVSSVATLGRRSGDQQLDENSHWDPSADPSNYAISKYGAEREVWRAMAEGLPAVIVNPSIILGPGDWTKGSAALFDKVYRGFPFYTEGVSGFVDVRDVCEALLFLQMKGITGERYILNGHSAGFDLLFRRIAETLNVRPPWFKIAPWMASVAWPIDKIRSLITGTKPFITRETARSARSRFYYSSDKIRHLGFQFRPLDKTLSYTAGFMKPQTA
jgi:nucleoside-diphosphate-sugar epimerase